MLASALYAAMVEEEANDLAAERRRRQLNRPAPAPSAKDIEQDSRIRAIEHENIRLKATFASLVHVLMERDLLNEDAVRQILTESSQLG